MNQRPLSLALAAAAATVTPAAAADFRPAVVFDIGGKADKSFNQGVYQGAERFRKESGVDYKQVELTDEGQREQVIEELARDGYSPIIAAGYGQADAIDKAASRHRDQQFAIIDMVVDQPNVASVIFKEQEGSYVVGVLAGMASQSGTVGFIGGMDIPLIHRFACGFVGGVKSVNPEAVILEDMIGTTSEAWRNPAAAEELARAQLAKGADVIYHAAGGSGVGVLRAAAQAGKLGIGVDSNQNALYPGKVLTSMLKRVDVAAYTILRDSRGGHFAPGLKVLGLAENAIGWALDASNRDVVTPEMKAAAEKAAAAISSGELKVHDYMSDSSCPY